MQKSSHWIIRSSSSSTMSPIGHCSLAYVRWWMFENYRVRWLWPHPSEIAGESRTENREIVDSFRRISIRSISGSMLHRLKIFSDVKVSCASALYSTWIWLFGGCTGQCLWFHDARTRCSFATMPGKLSHSSWENRIQWQRCHSKWVERKYLFIVRFRLF